MKVAVLGATGHTGRLVVRALRGRGAEVIACGRSREALAALQGPGVETRVADARRLAEVEAALRDADAVANLAGPFLSVGDAPARAAISRAIPYADTTGEQAFMDALRRDHHAAARRAGVALVSALAYEYAYADLAVRAHLPEGGSALHVLYRARGARASAGTRKSALGILGAPSLGYEEGALRPVPPARFARGFGTDQGPRWGVSFPGGEALTVPRHTPFRTIRTYLPARRPRLVRAAAPLARALLRGPALSLAQRAVGGRHAARSSEGARAEIHLVADARHLIVRMADPYEATAEILAEGILSLPRATATGVVAPAEALPADEVLAALARRMPDLSVGSFTAPRG